MKLAKTQSTHHPHEKTNSLFPFPQLRFHKKSFAKFNHILENKG